MRFTFLKPSVNFSYQAIPVLGILTLAVGFILTIAGIKLSFSGGSAYYLLLGIGLMVSSVYLIVSNPLGVWLYAMIYIAGLLWTYWEVGFNLHGLALRIVVNVISLISLFFLFYLYPRLHGDKPEEFQFKLYYSAIAIIILFVILFALNFIMFFYSTDLETALLLQIETSYSFK